MSKVGSEARYFAQCEACGSKADCDYVKYVFHGFELMYMICMPCFAIARVAGIVSLRADIEAYKKQLDLPILGE